MTKEGLVIRSIFFGDGLIEILFMELPTDIRAQGTLAMSRTLSIDTDRGDYGSEVDEVEAAALALLRDALEDFQAPTPPPDVVPANDR